MATDDNTYRIIGDVIIQTDFSKVKVKKGTKIEYSYGLGKSTNFQHIAILQSRKAFTPKTPYFEFEILKNETSSNVAIGIAPLHILGHAGQYNNSVGYHSSSGRIYSSWKANANTLGVPFSRGHKIGVYVTYFGEHLSTVLFFYDNVPIATRYYFDGNRDNFLPTVTFSGGAADVVVTWPSKIIVPPTVNDIPISQWIRGPTATYDSFTGVFENPTKLEDLPIQSPEPLSNSFRGFIVTQEQVSPTDGKGASVGLTTFSPLKPTPTCPLMKDYYTWFAKMKMKVGNSIGWGIFYEDDSPNDKAEQLCLVFVMFNNTIIDGLFVLQPEGGFLPIVLLQPYASKVTISKKTALSKEEFERLTALYQQMLGPAMEILGKDRRDRELNLHSFRTSDQVILDANDRVCRILVPKTETPVHYVQLCKALTPERRFFFVELDKISDHCQVTIGIASGKHRLNEAPGMDIDTVGYNSHSGLLYSNRKELGNTRGHRCRQGDTIGVEIQTFGEEMSVVLFTKNFRPVGTRYLTLKNHQQFFPTILIDSNTESVELSAYWQNRISVPLQYNIKNLEDWCVPEKTQVDLQEKLFILPDHVDHSLCIQAPSSLNRKLTHFEITLMDSFSDNDPPPAVAICTASPMDPVPKSQFKHDYLRFWATGDAGKYLKQGDKIGWGIIFPPVSDSEHEKEQEELLICYLTINRSVNYYRVLRPVVGGFYPVIVAPPNVNRIKLDMDVKVPTEDFTNDQIQSILSEARSQIEAERFMSESLINANDDDDDDINIRTNELQFANHVVNQMKPKTVPEVKHERKPIPMHTSSLPPTSQEQSAQSAACTIL